MREIDDAHAAFAEDPQQRVEAYCSEGHFQRMGGSDSTSAPRSEEGVWSASRQETGSLPASSVFGAERQFASADRPRALGGRTPWHY